MWTPQASSPSTTSEDGTWTGFDERWRKQFNNERMVYVVPDEDDEPEVFSPSSVEWLRDQLKLEVIGADGDSPTLVYTAADGGTGMIRPALEPEVRMWMLLRTIQAEEYGDGTVG
jgi:hypothetical protein